MSTFIFLGPTVPVERARAILDAEYLPPVSCGDVYALMRRRPQVIGIVDGVFSRVPSVWHKEILHALSQGTRVIGAASMGALRAAELAPFGMEGIGRVFEAYAKGVYEDDDEVAVGHSDARDGFRPLSEAMVNIRFGLASALDRRLISRATFDRLIVLGKLKFYPERSWPVLFADGRRAVLPANEMSGLEQFVAAERPNAKQDDAIAMLQYIGQIRKDGVKAHVSDFDFHPTFFWKKLTRFVDHGSDAFDGRGETLVAMQDYSRVASFNRSDLFSEALLAVLAADEVQRRGLEIPADLLEEETRRLRETHSDLEDRDLSRLATQAANISSLIKSMGDELATQVRLALLRRRDHAEVEAAVAKLRHADSEPEVDLDVILDWYRQRHRLGELSVDELSDRLGFDTERFLEQLIAHYRHETTPNGG